MNALLQFIKNNKVPLLGVFIGILLGYVYWYYLSCFWGTYPLSSECWVNCTFGAISGGFLASLLEEKKLRENDMV